MTQWQEQGLLRPAFMRAVKRRSSQDVFVSPLSLRVLALASSMVVGAVPCALSLSGCSGDASPASENVLSGDPAGEDSSAPGDRDDAPSPGSPPPGSQQDAAAPAPPCDATQTAAIQASFDKAAPDDIDAEAVVKDASCGVRYFTRGPSKFPETSLHLIASNSKTHLASLILLLIEDGKLHFDDPVSTWIDKVPGGNAITIRHLLNHTSGLYNYSNSTFYQLAAATKKKYTPQELVDLAFGQKVSFSPGESGKWEYSNTNYVLLGMIVEKITGKPVEQVLRERILFPAGLTATFFYGKETVEGDIAPGKSFLGTNGATFMDPSAFWCAGSYVSTLTDLANWAELRGSGAFHTDASNAALMDTVPTVDPGLRYGAGIMVYDASATHGGGPAIGHGGDLVGYHSYGFYFPDKKTTVVVMVDSDKGKDGNFLTGSTYRSQVFFSVIDPLFGYVPTE